MNRKEILEQAKNTKFDEGEYEILKTSSLAAYIILVAVISIMATTSVTQYFTKGESFANPLIFIIQLLVALAVQTCVRLYYKIRLSR
ncbi:MAG: hypothetical protein BEN19_05260 [Epulopiscium sp. Nuni2H_MBin003]|nr:MAG: hypothetical protein BEN19_05260 [Epulopiscium sp. Nuni2H_MBin003]